MCMHMHSYSHTRAWTHTLSLTVIFFFFFKEPVKQNNNWPIADIFSGICCFSMVKERKKKYLKLLVNTNPFIQDYKSANVEKI